MPVKRFMRGSGITKQDMVQIELAGPEDGTEREALFQMLNRSFTFEGLYGGALETISRRILDASGMVFTDGGERLIGNRHAIVGRDFEHDSEIDYAFRVLTLLRLTRACIRRNEAAEAARMACELGGLAMEAGIKFEWEGAALTGQKVVDGGKAGHRSTYGDSAERYRPLVETFERLRASGLSISEAQRRAAADHDVTSKTIYRARQWAKRTHLTVSD